MHHVVNMPQFVVILHEHVQLGDLLVLGSNLGDGTINIVLGCHESVVLSSDFVNNTLGMNILLVLIPVDLCSWLSSVLPSEEVQN